MDVRISIYLFYYFDVDEHRKILASPHARRHGRPSHTHTPCLPWPALPKNMLQ